MGVLAAAVICGSYFGDNLSMISDTTIGATQGVGAEMKDKFRINIKIASIPAILTAIMFFIMGKGENIASAAVGEYNILTIIPYFLVLGLAIIGLDVVLVMTIGIAAVGVIGLATGTGFFTWTAGISTGMEGMFWLAVFAMVMAGIMGMVRYYGGLDWMIDKMRKQVRGEKSCEFVILLIPLLIAIVIVNSTMTVMISAPICKELGEKYHVPAKRMAGFIDIGACMGVTLMPHGNGILMSAAVTGCSYGQIFPYLYYSFFLIIAALITIGFGLFRDKEDTAKK